MKKSNLCLIIALSSVIMMTISGFFAVNYNRNYDGTGVYRLFDYFFLFFLILTFVAVILSVSFVRKERPRYQKTIDSDGRHIIREI